MVSYFLSETQQNSRNIEKVNEHQILEVYYNSLISFVRREQICIHIQYICLRKHRKTIVFLCFVSTFRLHLTATEAEPFPGFL